MRKIGKIAILLLCFQQCFANTALDPVTFEKIWLQNNQRNIFKRYHYYNEQVQKTGENLYRLDLDAAPDRKIKTSIGDNDALISRMGIHYQSPKYLFLVDWLSAIPQPQETEGFTYGDLILARTWNDALNHTRLSLGLRQTSTPRTLLVNSEEVFDARRDATRNEYSVFFHLNYQGYDLGTYYSEKNNLDILVFYIPIEKSHNYSLSSTVYYIDSNKEQDIYEHYELSLDAAVIKSNHHYNIGLTASAFSDIEKRLLSNFYIEYTSPAYKNIKFILGAYYYDDLNENDLRGAKLGCIWEPERFESSQIGFFIRRNTVGDFNALVIPNETIMSFSISAEGFDLF